MLELHSLSSSGGSATAFLVHAPIALPAYDPQSQSFDGSPKFQKVDMSFLYQTEDVNSQQDISDNLPDSKPGLSLTIEPFELGICRLRPRARTPSWIHKSAFYSVSRSRDELSIVCEAERVPERIRCERGWRAIKVLGTLDFSLIGVLSSLAGPLTEAQVSIFSISTYDTDYLLVRDKNLKRAVAALEKAGHQFEETAAEEHTEKSVGSKPVAKVVSKESAPAEKSAEIVAADSLIEMEVEEPAEEPVAASAEKPSAEKPSAEKPAGRRRRRRRRQRPRAIRQAETSPDIENTTDETTATENTTTEETAAEETAAESVTSENTADDGLSTPAKAKKPRRRRQRRSGVSVGSAEKDSKPARRWNRAETPVEAAEIAVDEPETEATEEVIEAVEVEQEAPMTAARKSLPGDDPSEEPEEAGAEGLFTGAIPQHEVEVTDFSFANLGLSEPILETVKELGFEHPTPIQAAVIPEAIEGADVIGLAETGSGKTAAFCLPLAEHLTHGQGVRGLILCPTREIALQTKAFLDIFGRDHDLETVAVIGGVRMGPQISGLRRNPDILVATPGRLADHLRRGNVSLRKLEELVLDEADHMLDLGFLPQIKEILEQAPSKRRTMMFSATMPPPIERLAQMFMNNPISVDIRPVGQVAEGIEHRLYLVGDQDLKDCLSN